MAIVNITIGNDVCDASHLRNMLEFILWLPEFMTKRQGRKCQNREIFGKWGSKIQRS